MAIAHGHPAGWFVLLDGAVIGDCGTHGAPDSDGVVEIGYGLSSYYRGMGFGSEAVAAISNWLLDRPHVHIIRASTEPSNTASRRVLEKAGYRLVHTSLTNCVYELTASDKTNTGQRERTWQ